MTRTHDDEWDLASSVGATATMVAAGRAMATKDPRGLIDDPFAEPLVRAVGVDFFTKMMDGELDLDAIENATPVRIQSMVDGMAVRTKYFDDYFVDATDAGVRQVVILASGLDSRAYRLPWPAGTVVYEIDQPRVIEFKSNTLAEVGAEPTATRRTIPIDLRGDWPAALSAAGFDPAAPTAWLAEGLLIYLPPEAQDRLFDNITALSAPGSTIATEFVPGIVDFDAERVREMSGSFREHGVDIDMASLVYAGERNHVIDYLNGLGWRAEGVTRTELFHRHGIEVPAPEHDDPLGEIIFISATRTG
ncbi:class I SAM-dependent methyltransferase [Mycobacterium avium subsp. hominissuis]|jgi:methyltransferase (TIGR00027 family)|uniref:Putative S-adenosyl-L-methionine-dependent methyltransferase MAV_4444 n=3 Tax=Mycobacterium avium complex (MAC) TaxID=120793 RepID=Y4444_MYCA1|nr:MULTISPECIES: class I SAM-dependent methyltransferase [Mycobacterium avium complex (MAC)]A0QKZ0.1 RecName: Full=Putative S-adenosyl-L-methionine-dependent methyltransferase MAV_4444 [Mycobacterium avium 104]EUA36421.1 methyltransferase, TIGR00027 family protein [Mycobacterium avium subsp. avium 2285 (R)]TXA42603.1 class I SAM-dependent methyltransferase [Mycobacterium tuberculosis variant bovis]ABK66429.1 methyltransferase, putative, family protein [Mycobacterium avium 104]ANR93942.1 SAM-de